MHANAGMCPKHSFSPIAAIRTPSPVETGGMPEAGATFDTVERVLGRPAIGWADFARSHKNEVARPE